MVSFKKELMFTRSNDREDAEPSQDNLPSNASLVSTPERDAACFMSFIFIIFINKLFSLAIFQQQMMQQMLQNFFTPLMQKMGTIEDSVCHLIIKF